MTTTCPKCGSRRVSTRNFARKIGGSIGTVAGAFGAFNRTLTTIRIGSSLGSVIGPPGAILGGLSGALLSAFLGGLAGGGLGIKLGELVDDNILDNYHCDACGNNFSKITDINAYLNLDDLNEDDEIIE